MWETISSVLLSSNAWLVLLFCLVILIWLSVLAKKGLFKLSMKGIRIASDDKERTIIRNQAEWAKLYCEGMEARIPHPEGYNVWRGRYILECVYDEILTWITYNHITTNESYVEIKQNKVINLINSLTDKEDYHSKEFRETIKEEMKFVITKLVQIRELYG